MTSLIRAFLLLAICVLSITATPFYGRPFWSSNHRPHHMPYMSGHAPNFGHRYPQPMHHGVFPYGHFRRYPAPPPMMFRGEPTGPRRGRSMAESRFGRGMETLAHLSEGLENPFFMMSGLLSGADLLRGV